MLAPPHGIDQIRLAYGDIAVVDGKISPRSWEGACMTMVSDLPGVARKLYVNKIIVEPLRLALQRCIDLHDGYSVRTIGCFNPRNKRVNEQPSLHSWGVAVDINADENPLADAPCDAAAAKHDIPDAWVAIFEAVGWTWGGHFRRPDPMHFQFASGY